MLNYLYKRISHAVEVLLLVSIITFAVLMWIPGDAAQLILGSDATPEKLAALRSALGLDRPWYLQYWDWLKGFVSFDLGKSYLFGQDVSTLIRQRLPVTMSIAVFSMIIATVISIVLGILAAIRKNTAVDYVSTGLMQLGSSVPAFWIGMMSIVYLGLELQWFPIAGYVPPERGFVAYLNSIALPSMVLAIGEIGMLLRTVRTSMLDALSQDFMDMARAKGLSSFTIYFKYALRSAMIAPSNVIGLQFAKLVGGTVVVESVFSLPGIGRLILVAVEQRDVFLLLGLVMFITTLVIAIALLVDIAVMFINPRIRVEMQGE
ncbi:MAG: ABC transporter permease [Syntrophomonadaceae bacterium]|nr:ABC transporter permease [Syntrophomonadaceae bacterium]